jgi:DNA-binding GntR family transcriptional regulator
MDDRRVQSDYPAWAKNNDRFHEIIFSSCGSTILGELIQNIRLRIHPFRIIDAGLEKSIYNSEHKEILEAIRSGNARSAERLMAAHIETAKKNRIQHFLHYNELLSKQNE